MSVGVAPEMDFRECTLCSPLKLQMRKPTLTLKHRGDVTKNPKQGYKWPQNKTRICQKRFKKSLVYLYLRFFLSFWHLLLAFVARNFPVWSYYRIFCRTVHLSGCFPGEGISSHDAQVDHHPQREHGRLPDGTEVRVVFVTGEGRWESDGGGRGLKERAYQKYVYSCSVYHRGREEGGRRNVTR